MAKGVSLKTISQLVGKAISKGSIATTVASEGIGVVSNISKEKFGYDFLGSGGGGSTRLSEIMVNQCLSDGKEIQEIDLKDLPDEANVICFGLMGSPAVFGEKPPFNVLHDSF